MRMLNCWPSSGSCNERREPDDLVRNFGTYLLGFFKRRYPHFFEGVDAKQFLANVGDIIHSEVRKLYPGAGVLSCEYIDLSPDRLIML